MEHDFGFSLVESTNINKLKKDSVDGLEAANYFYQQLQLMHRTITPLLENLAKDPSKDIHWPDRDTKIKDFLKRIDEIAGNNPFEEIIK